VVYDSDMAIRGGGDRATRKASRGANQAATTAIKSTTYFSKANLYANSNLPAHLPPLRLYMPTYPLLCLAASFSQQVYSKPTGQERETHVEASHRLGTKAMVIKSVPADDLNTIVFAIRGTQTFMDWAVNLQSVPVSPKDFLDDEGNHCHQGFLHVARKMVKPVADRLESLLHENPSRRKCSLLITGHSAGGAVAALLYAHMAAQTVKSNLTRLTRKFKRIHCVTFGAPPVSLLPLDKPNCKDFRKSIFLSFINEHDPVTRADKAYVKSLLNLYVTPAPGASCISTVLTQAAKAKQRKNGSHLAPTPTPIYWKLPKNSPLSNAGRLVVLRPASASHGGEKNVKALITNDEQMRHVVFGDPLMHQMDLYAKRIETLATNAVLAKQWR
jgi:Lipase (class 3)